MSRFGTAVPMAVQGVKCVQGVCVHVELRTGYEVADVSDASFRRYVTCLVGREASKTPPESLAGLFRNRGNRIG